MRPEIDMKRCFASQSVCKSIKACPMGAISYAEADKPIMDKNLQCNCTPSVTKTPSCESEIRCSPPAFAPPSCGCADGECGNDLYSCGGTPYGRIIIDYDKCTGCGICADECCGSAIVMAN